MSNTETVMNGREIAAGATIISMLGGLAVVLVQAIYAAVMAPIPEPLPTPVAWYVVKENQVIESPSVIAVAESLEDGNYKLIGFPKIGKITERNIVISGAVIPTPEPPKPEPPKPEPVVPSGKRTVVILRETAGTPLATQSLLIGMRTGAAGKYLQDKGHTLAIVDMDSVDENDKETPLVKAWRAEIAGLKLPVIVVAEQQGNALKAIGKKEIQSGVTPDNLIEFIRQNGG